MNVAFLISSLDTGGAQRATTYLANSFVTYGWRVTILVMSPSSDGAYVLDKRVSVLATGLAGESQGKFSALRSNLNRIFQIRKLLKVLDLDVAIGMGSTVNILLSLASIGLKQLVIGSERSHPEFRQTSLVWRLLRARLYRYLDLSVCLTTETASWLCENTSLRRAEVIPNGIELPLSDKPPIVEVFSFVGKDNFILTVGRLIQTKQFDHAIHVFSKLAEDFPDWKLVIAGEGPERTKLERQISMCGLHGRVVLLGTVGNLGDWYSACSAFLLLSRLEGFPNSLLEAMAHSRACVSYDCKAGPRTLIQHSINGELVPLDCREEVVKSLRRVMGDSGYRKKIGDRAGRVVKENSMEEIAARWSLLIHTEVTRKTTELQEDL